MSPRGEVHQNLVDTNWQHRGGFGFDLIESARSSTQFVMYAVGFQYQFE